VARVERPRRAFGTLIFTDFADRGPLGANKRLNISPPINHSRDANPSRWARAVKRSDRVLSLARVQVNLDEREGKERERERERKIRFAGEFPVSHPSTTPTGSAEPPDPGRGSAQTTFPRGQPIAHYGSDLRPAFPRSIHARDSVTGE